jgi:hypothetical protein
MRSLRLVVGLLATAVALSACKKDPPSPPEDGAPSFTAATLAETTVGASYSATLAASGGKTPYTFSAQGLPPGISLASDSGALSGAASAAGDFEVQATVTGANGKQDSRTLPLKVHPPVAFKQSALPQATAQAPYSATLEVEGGKAPYTLRLAAGTLPDGVSLNATSRQLVGAFPAAGTLVLTFEATDAHGAKVTQAFTLTVAAPLRFDFTALPAGNLNAAYSEPVTVSGGRAPLTVSLDSGALPPGLTLGGETISGTATTGGRFSFALKVTDANGASTTLATFIDIFSHLPPRLTTTTLPDGVVGRQYAAALAGAEGIPPYTFALTTGTLPAGLQLSTNGVLSGTPTTGETQTVELALTDSRGQRARRGFTFTIYGPMGLKLTGLADGYRGRAYSQTLATRGKEPYSWSVQGALPPGLTLTTSGQLSGTPTATGTFTPSLSLTDALGQALSGPASLVIYEPPAITTTQYADGYVGDAYTTPAAGAGGKAPLTWSLASGALPAGVSLNATTGALSGTPTQAGPFSFTLQVRDANNEEASRPLQGTLYAPPALTSPATLPSAYAGQPYTAALTATGGKGTLTFSIASGALPSGLSLSSSGAITGTVNASVAHATTSTFTVRVQDTNGKAITQALELTTHRLPQIASTALTVATEGVDYRASEASPERLQVDYGRGPLGYAAQGLPQGLSLNPTTGELSGTPAQGTAGSHPVTFTVTDAGNRSANRVITLQVVKPKPTLFGGVVGLAPAGSRITDTLTVFTLAARVPMPNVGVRVRKNGQEYNPPKEALTNAEGKVVFTGLGLNGTTDTVDITANGKDLVNSTMAQVNASVVTLRLYWFPQPGTRLSASGAYDPASRRFLITGGLDSTSGNSLFYSSCLNDVVEAVDIGQKSFTTRVPGGLSTSPSPRYEAGMAIAGGAAVLFGGRNCGETGDSLGDTWEFDLASNTWAQVTPAGLAPQPRRAPALVRDASGNSVYMLGGYRNPTYSNELWRYTPATNTWTQLPAAPIRRAYAAGAANTVTGELWFCGGRTSGATAECQAFNPTAQSWSGKPALPTARSDSSLAFDPVTETFYAFGGRATDGSPFGDLLVLRKGAAAWESVIPPGATPTPRYGHVMYFDLTRRELVLAMGTTRNAETFVTTRLGDVWTYDGTAWTERGTPLPTPVGYSVSGQLAGGPVNGLAHLNLGTTSGFRASATVSLDAQGRGSYTLANVPPGEPALITVVGEDPNLNYPSNLWTYTDAQLPGLAGNTPLNITLPAGPAVLLHATGNLVIPASWRGQPSTFIADPYLQAPGFPLLSNGRSTLDGQSNKFDVSYVATATPGLQRIQAYLASEGACEDYGLYTVLRGGNQDISVGGNATGLSPGRAECIPKGPSGVGIARIRASASAVQRLTVGDLDGDTFPDLVLPLPTFFNMGILWGTPELLGAFTDFCCDVSQSHSAAVGDFNKDGKLDLAATEPGSNLVKVSLADATTPRTFGFAATHSVGPGPTGIAAADVTGDGFLDLLVARQDGFVSILEGGAGGVFTNNGTLVQLAGTAPSQVLVTNVDGDTLPDLVVTMAEGISVTLDGFAQWPFGTSLLTPISQPSAVVVGRLNGDNLPDIAVASAASNSVAVYLGAGGGTFASPISVPAGTAPAGLALAELTGDAHLDLAVSSATDGVVTLLQGASNGTFTPHSKVPVPGDPRGLVAVDFNGDGLNDLAVASPSANGVYMLLGRRPLPTSAGTTFSFTAPANASYMWSVHGIDGFRRYWDYYAPLQPGPVSYALPLPSTLAPSSAPTPPANGKLTLGWTPWVRKWEPARPFNPRQFSLLNLGHDADTQPGAHLYLWP